jgi:1-acyl-sn-glycerol-3-phosphate acyltransferase
MPAEPWQYDTVEDLSQTLVERLRNFPRELDITVYGLRSLAALAIRGWLRTYHRLSIVGREHLPATGSFVLVANHASHLDALSIASALPLAKLHRVFPAAAKDFFFVSAPRTAIAAVAVNALPFDRQANIRQSLSLCRELLANPGNILLIFPEGTRTTTGELGDFKPGVGLLLAGAECPVIPCHLDGAFAAMPKGSYLPRPRKLRLTIGTPRTYAHLERGKQSAMAICQDLRQAIVELSAGASPPSNPTTSDAPSTTAENS